MLVIPALDFGKSSSRQTLFYAAHFTTLVVNEMCYIKWIDKPVTLKKETGILKVDYNFPYLYIS